jgi:hypothetical protein
VRNPIGYAINHKDSAFAELIGTRKRPSHSAQAAKEFRGVPVRIFGTLSFEHAPLGEER